MAVKSHPIQIGLEVCVAKPPAMLSGKRFGVLMNQASVDHRLRYACDVLADAFPGQEGPCFDG